MCAAATAIPKTVSNNCYNTPGSAPHVPVTATTIPQTASFHQLLQYPRQCPSQTLLQKYPTASLHKLQQQYPRQYPSINCYNTPDSIPPSTATIPQTKSLHKLQQQYPRQYPSINCYNNTPDSIPPSTATTISQTVSPHQLLQQYPRQYPSINCYNNITDSIPRSTATTIPKRVPLTSTRTGKIVHTHCPPIEDH